MLSMPIRPDLGVPNRRCSGLQTCSREAPRPYCLTYLSLTWSLWAFLGMLGVALPYLTGTTCFLVMLLLPIIEGATPH
jgi:hypothetical protein